MSFHDKFFVQLIDFLPSPCNQLIDNIAWPFLLRDATQPVRWMKLGTVMFTTQMRPTMLLKECQGLFQKVRERETNLWRVLISKWWNFSLTFYVTWRNVTFFNHCMWLFLICNETVRTDGTFVTSVQRWDADARNQCWCLLTVFSCRRGECLWTNEC